MNNPITNKKMKVLVLENTPLSDAITERLKPVEKEILSTADSIANALRNAGESDLFILAENKLFFYKAASGYLENYPLSALPYILDREEVRGRH